MSEPPSYDASVTLPTPPAALLLDMDGTLVDTEGVWFEAERVAAERFGGHLPADANAELVGLDTDSVVATLRRRYGVDAAPATLRGAIVEALGDALRTARAYRGAAELVAAALERGVRLAVVSNSPRAVVEATLAPHPWAERLTLRLSADDVRRPKPAPDLYRLALERIGLDAARCAVVEDSPTGASAALAAGIACVAVLHDPAHERALRALTPHVVPSLGAAARCLALADGATTER